MKIRVTSFYKIIIYFLVFINSGFYFFSRNAFLTIAFSIPLCIISFVYKKSSLYIVQYMKIKQYITLIYLFIAIEFLRLMMVSNVFGIKGIFSLIAPYFYLTLVFPILDILFENKETKFFRNVICINIIATIFRFLIWYLYNFKGLSYFSSIFQEHGIDWVRNGVVRLDAPPLDGLSFISMVFILYFSKSVIKKICSLSVLSLLFSYSWFVYNSRSQMICYVLTMIFMYLIKPVKFKSDLLIKNFITIVFIAMFLLHFRYVETFINTFTSGDMLGSTLTRVNEYDFFSNMFSQNLSHILFGIGITQDLFNVGNMQYYLSDLGLLGFIFTYGLIGFCIFLKKIIFDFMYGIRKIKETKNINLVFLVGILFYTIMSSILSQDVFDYVRIFAFPFIIAIVEKIKFEVSSYSSNKIGSLSNGIEG